jgi:phenylacetate-CoA ligase
MVNINQRLQEVISFAYANAPAVRQRFDVAGIKPADIQNTADLSRIPVLAKDDVIALQQADPPFGGLLSVPLSEVRHIFLSPGPIYEPDVGDDTTPVDMALLCLQKSGFTAEDVVLNTLSYHLVPAGELLDSALRALGSTVIPGGVGNSDLQIKMMRDLNVTGYVGTPSFLIRLIEKAEKLGLDFRRDLKVTKAFVSTEPLFPALRQRLTEEYGLTLGNGYATAELGFLAINVDGSLPMQLLPRPIVEVIDPDTGQSVAPGEVGEVVVTNLNPAYPLIRLGTGDIAVNVDPNPGASKQEERAVILVGRRGDAVKVRGMFVHPNQLRFALAQTVPFKAFQGIITQPETRDHFTLQVTLANPDQAGDLAALSEKIKAQVRGVCRVTLDEVVFVEAGTIPENAPGMVDRRDWQS